MTTTKEEQIRAAFALRYTVDMAEHGEYRFDAQIGYEAGWEDCAEAYEKKLAELNNIIQENARSWAEQHVELLTARRQLSEAHARNAMLVEAEIEMLEGTIGCTDFERSVLLHDRKAKLAELNKEV